MALIPRPLIEIIAVGVNHPIRLGDVAVLDRTRLAHDAARNLPGFCRLRKLAPLLPLGTEGLLLPGVELGALGLIAQLGQIRLGIGRQIFQRNLLQRNRVERFCGVLN